jgi:hypothetical protein
MRFLWFASRSEDVVLALSHESVLVPLVHILAREATRAASAECSSGSDGLGESASVAVKVVNNFAAASRNKLVVARLGAIRPLLTLIACAHSDLSARTANVWRVVRITRRVPPAASIQRHSLLGLGPPAASMKCIRATGGGGESRTWGLSAVRHLCEHEFNARALADDAKLLHVLIDVIVASTADSADRALLSALGALALLIGLISHQARPHRTGEACEGCAPPFAGGGGGGGGGWGVCTGTKIRFTHFFGWCQRLFRCK